MNNKESELNNGIGTEVPILDDGIGTRISEIAEAVGGVTALAQLTGISDSQIYRYIKTRAGGGSEPKLEALRAIAKAGNTTLDWLIDGIGPKSREEAEMAGIKEERRALYRTVSPEEFVFIPRYDAEVSAGHGVFLEQDQVRDRLAFKRSWVREMGFQPDLLALVTVKGDSMEPTLFDGDIILVDLATTEAISDGIYVLRQDDQLKVKRLQRLFTGDLIIRSDNQSSYKEETVPKEQLGQIVIFGRAVWLGRHL